LVNGWADSNVCNGCDAQSKQADGKLGTNNANSADSALNIFKAGETDIQAIQAKVKEIGTKLVDAQQNIGASKPTLGTDAAAVKPEGCGQVASQACLNQYWITTNGRFEDAWKTFNGKNSLDAYSGAANSGTTYSGAQDSLQDKVNKQQRALDLGVTAVGQSGTMKTAVDNARTSTAEDSPTQLIGFQKAVLKVLAAPPGSDVAPDAPTKVKIIMGKIGGDSSQSTPSNANAQPDATLLGNALKANKGIETDLTKHRDNLTRFQNYDFSGAPAATNAAPNP
jgi:hypothetical protein